MQNHQADSPLYVWPDVWSADLHLLIFKSMVIHDTECPYWDQVSLNNTNQTKTTNHVITTYKQSPHHSQTNHLLTTCKPSHHWQMISLSVTNSLLITYRTNHLLTTHKPSHHSQTVLISHKPYHQTETISSIIINLITTHKQTISSSVKTIFSPLTKKPLITNHYFTTQN